MRYLMNGQNNHFIQKDYKLFKYNFFYFLALKFLLRLRKNIGRMGA